MIEIILSILTAGITIGLVVLVYIAILSTIKGPLR